MPDVPKAGERMFQGIPVSAGVCRGKIRVLARSQEVSIPKYTVGDSELPEQTNRLQQALLQTRRQILEVQRRVDEALGASNASIFDAHLLVLEDPVLVQEVIRTMEKDKVNVEHAFSVVSAKYVQTLDALDDDYLRERAADMRDVTARILHNLLGRAHALEAEPLLNEPSILVTHDLTPSRTAGLDKRMVLGFATDVGGRTSHTAILARSLEIPAVTGLQDASQRLKDGQYALLDGFNGLLITDPTDKTLFEYGQLARRQVAFQDRLRELRDQPAVTLDGVRVTLSANIEQAEETGQVTAHGADGVGLYRTEYLYLNRRTMPTEEEQFQAYHRVASELAPHPVIIRTLDLGGDKVTALQEDSSERNPFLGLRAIRICLQERELFRDQLRAILRASAVGNVKIMYPMISGLDELQQANGLLEEYKGELRCEGVPFDEGLEIGVMIEIPGAALTAHSLAKRVKFFSLGTNDLIQYSLAVDRMNPRIAHLYDPTHPAVLRLIKLTADAARANGIWTGVCGEMAGDPVLVPLLLGLGVDELSAAPPLVPGVKFIIRRLKLCEARELAEFALNCENGAEILARAQEFARAIAPGLFETQST